MNQEEKTKIEEQIVDVLKTVYDPEMPVDVWNLGMIYKIDVKDDHSVDVDMTLTAPNCPGKHRARQHQPRIRTHLGLQHDVGRSTGGTGV